MHFGMTCSGRLPESRYGCLERLRRLLYHFHSDFHAVVYSGGGGKIPDGHHRVATVAEKAPHVTLVNADIEYMALTDLTAADAGAFRTTSEARHDVAHKVLNSGDRLHEMGE